MAIFVNFHDILGRMAFADHQNLLSNFYQVKAPKKRPRNIKWLDNNRTMIFPKLLIK